jgi:hypothetical protein
MLCRCDAAIAAAAADNPVNPVDALAVCEEKAGDEEEE